MINEYGNTIPDADFVLYQTAVNTILIRYSSAIRSADQRIEDEHKNGFAAGVFAAVKIIEQLRDGIGDVWPKQIAVAKRLAQKTLQEINDEDQMVVPIY